MGVVDQPDHVPAYEIADEDDLSFGTPDQETYRVRYSVRTQEDATSLSESDIRAIGEDIISGQLEVHDANGISIEIVPDDEELGDGGAYGVVEWGPGGDFSKAADAAPGDYSDHEIDVTINSFIGAL